MKIGIMGTRGIPNRYGGFEQFAETLSEGLVKKGHEVFVYNSSLHEYKESNYQGVQIIHCPDKEDRLGTFGQFIYDRNCLKDSQTRDFEVLLHLGYTSDSVFHRRWPKNFLHVVNMDGLEWRRAKYSWFTKQFLKKAEALAARHADILVADNPAIKTYLENKYRKEAVHIPYPVTVFNEPDQAVPGRFGLDPSGYFLAVARMEPENNLEMIIDGYLCSGNQKPLVLIGNANNSYGKWLKSKYESTQIKFPGAIYEKGLLNNLRHFSAVYFHGHSVGGTNPSLLEAMACGCRIAAHGNEFNRAVLKEKGEFFTSVDEVVGIIEAPGAVNIQYDLSEYEIEKIISAYEKLFVSHGSHRKTTHR